MSNRKWAEHLLGLAAIETNTGKKVALQTSAEIIQNLEQQLADLKASLPKVRAEAVREAKKMTVLGYNTTNKDYEAGFDDGVEAYDDQLDMISEYMEAGNE